MWDKETPKAGEEREEALAKLVKRGAKRLLSLGREERQRADDNPALRSHSNTLS